MGRVGSADIKALLSVFRESPSHSMLCSAAPDWLGLKPSPARCALLLFSVGLSGYWLSGIQDSPQPLFKSLLPSARSGIFSREQIRLLMPCSYDWLRSLPVPGIGDFPFRGDF